MVFTLYTLSTPNGYKISIALEELKEKFDIKYEVVVVDVRKGEQFTESFIAVNPNSKIPALVDSDGPDGKPVTVFESGAILIYLAEKYGQLLPKEVHQRYATIQWLFWQMAGVGPMFGQFSHFYRVAPEKIEYAINRYSTEAKRLLAVLDKQLEGKHYIIGDEYTIADIAVYPWVRAATLLENDAGRTQLAIDTFANVNQWLARIGDRPAVKLGLQVPPKYA